MSRHLVLAAHLSTKDVERRYRAAKGAIERTSWQIVWLVSAGQTATAIARSTGQDICCSRRKELGCDGRAEMGIATQPVP